MHDIIDTEDFDASEERHWPDGYKRLLREGIKDRVKAILTSDRCFQGLYERYYETSFSNYEEFIQRLAEMTAIGAENGSDEMFEEFHAAVAADNPLPLKRHYLNSLLPGSFSTELGANVKAAIVQEYAQEHAYYHAFEHYADVYRQFDAFLDEVAELVVIGARRGSENLLQAIFHSLYYGLPLPPARRRPKRLKHR